MSHKEAKLKRLALLPAEPQRWLFGTWAVCCRWAGGRQVRKSSEASASPHKPAKTPKDIIRIIDIKRQK